jgi:hypothetical protein
MLRGVSDITHQSRIVQAIAESPLSQLSIAAQARTAAPFGHSLVT